MHSPASHPIARRLGGAAVATVLAVCVAGGTAHAAVVKGTVVDRTPSAKRFAVATTSGKVRTVAARTAPRVGTKVRVKGRAFGSGAVRARSLKRLGRTRLARVRGVVNAVSRARGRYGLDTPAGTLVVEKTRRRAGAAAAGSSPRVGTTVLVAVGFASDGDLEAKRIKVLRHGDDFDVEGILTDVDGYARTLTIAPGEEDDRDADDEEEAEDARDDEGDEDEDEGDDEDEEHGDDEDGDELELDRITVRVPAAFDLSLCSVGQEISVEVVFADGAYILEDAGDYDWSEDRSSSDDESDHSSDSSSSNACGDRDESEDSSSGDGDSDSSAEWSDDHGDDSTDSSLDD